jgi:2-oxoglutarate ferredoxin oxidoreductase subunit alpha
MRLRAYPFTDEVFEFVKQHERIYVVDQNRDGQMYQLFTLDLPNKEAAKLRSVRHYNGLPIDARSITDDIIRQEGK